MNKRAVKISKFVSLVLRHQPDVIGLELDEAGWASVDELLAGCRRRGLSLTLEELQQVVADNDKQRFAFSADGLLIRASQGHSIEVELGYEPAVPPPLLYHGTATRFLSAIKELGLVKGKRRHVHLSADTATANKVGERHGKPAVLEIAAARMHENGLQFYLSANGVWLTEHVPTRYLKFADTTGFCAD